MKSVLVIGAAGFVGPYLVENLRKHNFRVVPTKLSSQKNKDKTFINLNILNIDEIIQILKRYRPDYIVHLAAQANVGLSWKEPILTFRINVMGTLNLLEAVHKLKIKTKILLVGTSEEYGYTNKMPIVEDSQVNPNNFYALSKKTQESIGQIYVKNFGLNIVFTRSFNHIGPGQGLGFVVPDLCSQIVKIENNKNGHILYVGNLNSERDFTDVRDIANAYRLLLLKGKNGQIYNVGSGKSISIASLLNELSKLSTKKIKVVVDKNKFRPVDTPIIKANIHKLTKDTGFKIHYNIKSTLKEILEYYRNNI